MTSSLASVTLEVADTEAAAQFYKAAFGLGPEFRFRASDAPSTGFRGFTPALTVASRSDVDSFVESAVAAGATTLKPAEKSLWGYGAVVQAPDGTIWKIATSDKKGTGPATRTIEALVILLGVEDVKESKKFYVEQGLAVGKSFGGKYVEFAADPASGLTLALYKRRALAKQAGVPADGTGSHLLVLGGTAQPCTDPDGFVWEAVSPARATS
ncbi:glyoxalase [Streptomyces sp. SID8379]|uniref:glyoxalase n=1 Tax=unclassified Streptomyces TaxID=2593676 RepID=UPI0005BAF798|nr:MULTISPECIES: glyoxalase [unclassified Streptomyces]MYW64624.1 glyoxalase [Streptomyces sp. SID8379]